MLVFLKLGGSLITDKTQPETARYETIRRIADEIAEGLTAHAGLRLLIGHGSGSFGHSAGEQYRTRRGVSSAEAWRGFARVSLLAGRLNQIVLDALDAAGVPVLGIQPSASVVCQDGDIVRMALGPIQRALEEGLVPLVYGDVALDMERGGTIVSTEEVFAYLAQMLLPQRILIAGKDEGVLDTSRKVVTRITPSTLEDVREALQGSRATDVTGGMESKVTSMLALCEEVPGLAVRIFSGELSGNIRQALTDDRFEAGTLLTAG